MSLETEETIEKALILAGHHAIYTRLKT
jgi:hypothetical protein